MTIKKVRVTRTVKVKGGSLSFQVEAEVETLMTKTGYRRENYLKSMEELESQLHHWLLTEKMQERITHSKIEG